MGIFHCLVLVKKHNVTDVVSAFAISENMHDIGLESLRFFKKIKIKNIIHVCQLRHKTSEKGPVNSLYLKLFNPSLYYTLYEMGYRCTYTHVTSVVEAERKIAVTKKTKEKCVLH